MKKLLPFVCILLGCVTSFALDEKNYVCAFDPKNNPHKARSGDIGASYQITEFTADFKEINTRRWEGEKGLLTRINHRKNMIELKNYIISSGYGGMALRRTSILKNGKTVFEEQLIYDDKFNVIRKLQTENGGAKIIDYRVNDDGS